jgi:hypothetical protein
MTSDLIYRLILYERETNDNSAREIAHLRQYSLKRGMQMSVSTFCILSLLLFVYVYNINYLWLFDDVMREGITKHLMTSFSGNIIYFIKRSRKAMDVLRLAKWLTLFLYRNWWSFFFFKLYFPRKWFVTWTFLHHQCACSWIVTGEWLRLLNILYHITSTCMFKSTLLRHWILRKTEYIEILNGIDFSSRICFRLPFKPI